MNELYENRKEDEENENIEIKINNIANKLANILYITTVSMKENFDIRNNLPYAKLINDMKSYCVNLIQSITNLNSNLYNLTCLPVHAIPRNPYNNVQDVNTITNNISVDDTIEKIKENKDLLNKFEENYNKTNFNQIIKQIEIFNDNIFSALNNLEHIKIPFKYEETQSYGNILSDRLKNKHKDHEHLEVYIAKMNYGIF
ncbi:conserved Plasmodium protein, unknown function [Plasmodium vinckei]|uniref:Uncharacterized protein n=4 Tax=Plasmodium vinckei TaxID=5860 RepID=W7AIM4_PLAVN|nr:hypothetical protein YYG_03711 [Plasmodium vinckei petteri]CAD2088008.1 conserved Plasmodium protein, unknown function [Plasmodium vinckei brucechwatti]CAD2088040.1 conserved Plasmodium protein, unknown function [Plasmodium vinckei lentum]CAD2100020.1 conserved Plasmodium protein, unknown function [Plasmodium vinckei petteri]CAD2100070.1 conserved Plasmodium protein, unknown function [Plasmodium vinckei]